MTDKLNHYGVPGMKWGRRKSDDRVSASKMAYAEERSRTLESSTMLSKNGESVTITEVRNPKLKDFLSTRTSKGRSSLGERSKSFDITANGKSVGYASVETRPNKELYLNWLGINPKSGGKGYGSAAFKAAIAYGESKGYKKLTLEVPGISPNARHIYEKFGFQVSKEASEEEIKNDPIWGGLTDMYIDIPQKNLKHSEEPDLDLAISETFEAAPDDIWEQGEQLNHYGVPGMKWGVRKAVDRVNTGRKLKAESKYLKAGFSKSESERRAKRRIKVENVIAISAAVAIAAVAANAGYREYGKNFASVNLDPGTKMQHLSNGDVDLDIDRRLYVAYEKSDKKKYIGMFSKHLQRQGITNMMNTTLRATENIKAPSNQEAYSIYKGLMKEQGLGAGRTSYRAFNRAFVGSNFKDLGGGINDRGTAENILKFKRALQDRGYNAVLDSNDQYLSGFNAKRPLIIFNANSSSVKAGKKFIDEATQNKAYRQEFGKIVTGSLLETTSKRVALVGGAVGAIKLSNNEKKRRAVEAYLKANPGTKMTPSQIYGKVKKTHDGSFRVVGRAR